MKKLLPVIISFVIILVGLGYYVSNQPTNNIIQPTSHKKTLSSISNPQLLTAYKKRIAKLQVKGQGIIIKVLKDDLEGSRHQRLLLKVNENQTLLVAHNIDLAPRIPNPQLGEEVAFYGEYAWNNKGGVLHWTHKDPSGRHVAGWLSYQGKVYQ